MSPRTERVVPFVEDRKNCLVLRPEFPADPRVMASLEAVLKSAIQVEFQLEDMELAAEPLPNEDDRRYLLFYEAAEGGAGVLRRLVEDLDALPRVARRALEIAHFDPETGANRERAPGSKEACEAACYDCLMSYTNQPDHPLLDRKLVADILLRMTKASVAVAPGAQTREEAFERLLRQAGSELERKWLRFLMTGGYRLPTDAQKLFPQAGTRPDFVYAKDSVAVYVDGPPHDFPDRQARDAAKQAAMEDLGYIVLRFHHEGDWAGQLKKYPSVFGGAA